VIPLKAHSICEGAVKLPDVVLPAAASEDSFSAKNTLEGIVIDDAEAELKRQRMEGEGLKPYVGEAYRYAHKVITQRALCIQRQGTCSYEVRINFSSRTRNRPRMLPVTVLVCGWRKDVSRDHQGS